MPNVRVLVIEDDVLIVEFLRVGLGHEGFDLRVAEDGAAGLEAFQRERPHIVILDLQLPKLSGEEVCVKLRAESDVPILVLTARDQTADKLKLFELGADDYVVKPFSFDELLARLHALLRRRQMAGRPELKFMDIHLRTDTKQVARSGVIIELTVKEFELLELFLNNPRRVLTKEAILSQVWGYNYQGATNTVEVHVGSLRRKLGRPPVIKTVRGFGYCLRADAT